MTEETAAAIALNIESQFQENNSVNYDTERKKSTKLLDGSYEKIPPSIFENPVSNVDIIQKIKKLRNKNHQS